VQLALPVQQDQLVKQVLEEQLGQKATQVPLVIQVQLVIQVPQEEQVQPEKQALLGL
jgi:hypothetical protein